MNENEQSEERERARAFLLRLLGLDSWKPASHPPDPAIKALDDEKRVIGRKLRFSGGPG